MLFFFFNDTATTEIYTLSLHDALPIYFLDEVHYNETGNEVTLVKRCTSKLAPPRTNADAPEIRELDRTDDSAAARAHECV